MIYKQPECYQIQTIRSDMKIRDNISIHLRNSAVFFSEKCNSFKVNSSLPLLWVCAVSIELFLAFYKVSQTKFRALAQTSTSPILVHIWDQIEICLRSNVFIMIYCNRLDFRTDKISMRLFGGMKKLVISPIIYFVIMLDWHVDFAKWTNAMKYANMQFSL